MSESGINTQENDDTLTAQLLKSGTVNQMQAKFFSQVGISVVKNHISELKTYTGPPKTKPQKIAAALVAKYLSKHQMSLTIDCAKYETLKGLFIKQDVDVLGYPQNSDIISLLVQTRFLKPGELPKDFVPKKSTPQTKPKPAPIAFQVDKDQILYHLPVKSPLTKVAAIKQEEELVKLNSTLFLDEPESSFFIQPLQIQEREIHLEEEEEEKIPKKTPKKKKRVPSKAKTMSKPVEEPPKPVAPQTQKKESNPMISETSRPASEIAKKTQTSKSQAQTNPKSKKEAEPPLPKGNPSKKADEKPRAEKPLPEPIKSTSKPKPKSKTSTKSKSTISEISDDNIQNISVSLKPTQIFDQKQNKKVDVKQFDEEEADTLEIIDQIQLLEQPQLENSRHPKTRFEEFVDEIDVIEIPNEKSKFAKFEKGPPTTLETNTLELTTTNTHFEEEETNDDINYGCVEEEEEIIELIIEEEEELFEEEEEEKIPYKSKTKTKTRTATQHDYFDDDIDYSTPSTIVGFNVMTVKHRAIKIEEEEEEDFEEDMFSLETNDLTEEEEQNDDGKKRRRKVHSAHPRCNVKLPEIPDIDEPEIRFDLSLSGKKVEVSEEPVSVRIRVIEAAGVPRRLNGESGATFCKVLMLSRPDFIGQTRIDRKTPRTPHWEEEFVLYSQFKQRDLISISLWQQSPKEEILIGEAKVPLGVIVQGKPLNDWIEMQTDSKVAACQVRLNISLAEWDGLEIIERDINIEDEDLDETKAPEDMDSDVTQEFTFTNDDLSTSSTQDISEISFQTIADDFSENDENDPGVGVLEAPSSTFSEAPDEGQFEKD